MVQGSQRTRLTGPALVRLLSQLAEAEVPDASLPFAQRLGHWLGWTDAISLAAALNERPAASDGRCGIETPQQAVDRVRGALTRSIAQEFAARPARRGAPLPEPESDFAPWRRRCVARQRAMETAIAATRAQVRQALAARSQAGARLAAVDEVMERVLGEQEQALLAIVPTWLERRFERLAHRQPRPARWMDDFREEMHGVLLAELDLRLQPVEGLLEALRPAA